MADTGIESKGEYLRKMALEGIIFRLDMSEARELLRLIANATSNINQIAKRANESRSVYGNDVAELSIAVEQLDAAAREAVKIYREAKKILKAV
ncbi:MAG: plasmid mobilization relaxosome protein MobC [Defluviitaleaceae bacterium]|nr:plasmid mobilization relaxosome protein MobC [Defluviitaleaceae bacterium]